MKEISKRTFDEERALYGLKNTKVSVCIFDGPATMEDTDLSFERSEVDAVVSGRIEGVKNPLCGRIICGEIGDLLMETDFIDPSRTEIVENGKK